MTEKERNELIAMVVKSLTELARKGVEIWEHAQEEAQQIAVDETKDFEDKLKTTDGLVQRYEDDDKGICLSKGIPTK